MDANLPPLEQAIWQTLAYADIFDYALRADEIQRYLTGLAASPATVRAALKQNPQLFARVGELYTLPGREYLAQIRPDRARTAAGLWPQALRYGKIIAQLPFVRLVACTGALAMNNVEPGADIDYLIVTAPGHLWLTRALVLLLGRFASLRGVTLCPNYLISLRVLAFPDQNLYTAHELAQMIPLAGLDIYAEIRRRNGWVLDLLPNAADIPSAPFASFEPPPRSLARPVLEAVLQTLPFNWLEKWEMERKIRRLTREQSASAESTFSADVCKGHNQRHQSRTSLALAERMRLLEKTPLPAPSNHPIREGLG